MTRFKFKYEECSEIMPRPASIWLIEYEDGNKQLSVWHQSADILTVTHWIKLSQAKGRKFTVGMIDVGLFNLDKLTPVENSYSSDGRKINDEAYMVFD